jgi:dsRNA-specific ribonuclease
MGYGDGKKKKVAEQNASQDALIKLQVLRPDQI